MQTLKSAIRSVARTPGFSVAAILSLALAICANTAVFGVLNALVLRPLPVERADRVFFLQREQSPSHSFPLYRELRDRATLLDGIAAYRIAPMAMQLASGSQRLWGYLATGNYFDVLGVKPAIGRFFHAEDDRSPGNAPYAVLSYASWQSRFAGDPDVVGRVIRVKGRAFTILGVAPEGFRGTELFFVPDLWVPMMMQPHVEERGWLDNWGTANSWIVARLGDGVTPRQAEENLNAVATLVAREQGFDRPTPFALAAPGLIGDMLRAPMQSFSIALMLLAGLVLLAACVNLATLFVVRSLDRVRELGVKLALGAGRGRLCRELALEVIILSVAGGLAGLILASAALRYLTQWRMPMDIPVQIDLHADMRVFLFAVAAALVAGLAASIGPAWRTWRTDPNAALRASHGTGALSRWTFRDLLLAVQVACCCVLITGGIVSVRGLAGAFRTDVAMDVDDVTVAGFDLGLGGYTGGAGREFQRRALEAVAGIPGVSSAAYGTAVPLYFDYSSTNVFPEGAAPTESTTQRASYWMASPGYFQTLGTRVMRGREFSWQDDANAPRVAIVNETLARRMGHALTTGWRFRQCVTCDPIEVIGLVEDGKYQTLAEPEGSAVFFPILQRAELTTMVLVRSSRPQGEVAEEIRARLLALDGDLPLYSVGGLDEAIGFVFVPAWAATIMLNAFGVLAAMLVLTGVYGVAAYSVTRRAREISIRVAIGGRPAHVLQTVLGRVGGMLLAGCVVGIALGFSASRLLANVVYQATPADPVVLIAAAAVMAAIGLSATWLPARRALHVDPVRALRED